MSDSRLTEQSRILAIFLGALLAGCNDATSPSDRILRLTPADTVMMDAVGDSVTLQVDLLDEQGNPDPSHQVLFISRNLAVAQVSPEGIVVGTGNGSATVIAMEVPSSPGAVGDIADSVVITVSQQPHLIEAVWGDTSSVMSVAPGGLLPLTCTIRDRNGVPIDLAPVITTSAGTVSGSGCEHQIVQHSGFDTLTISARSLTLGLPFVLGVLPSVSSPAGEFVVLDSFPLDYRLWAPSGRINSQGQTEIYLTGYLFVQDSNGVGPGALHRLVSSDGSNFRYDGIALDLLPPPCELICSGIENIAVVERQDGPGWRMYFAAGSTGSYGWQVFSAVSSDERSWTIEPGVRITNGGPVPPAPPGTVPWPVGEGMVVDRLATGEWRMIVGGYERIPGAPDRFEIVEYRSPDQLSWTYQGTILTVAEAPVTAARSLYSPSIVEFTPGLWRMFFTGDDLHLPGGRSRIFSAVSSDRIHWKVESELLGAPGTDLYYTALVNDRLYFLRQDSGQLRRLAAVTLTMP